MRSLCEWMQIDSRIIKQREMDRHRFAVRRREKSARQYPRVNFERDTQNRAESHSSGIKSLISSCTRNEWFNLVSHHVFITFLLKIIIWIHSETVATQWIRKSAVYHNLQTGKKSQRIASQRCFHWMWFIVDGLIGRMPKTGKIFESFKRLPKNRLCPEDNERSEKEALLNNYDKCISILSH